MKKLFFVIGASGAGKSTAVKHLERLGLEGFKFFFFDSVGVPKRDEMIARFGSGEEWQRLTTHRWVERLATEIADDISAVLDAQVRPSFIDEACKKYGVENYEVILFDCSDEERLRRLNVRKQPHLANQDMTNWAKFLRDEAEKRNYRIIDNTHFSEEESVEVLRKMIS